MWQWLLTSLAVIGVLACPHECAVRASAALSLPHVEAKGCNCCNHPRCDDPKSESSAPAPDSDGQHCICDGVTVVLPSDSTVDLSDAFAGFVAEAVLPCQSASNPVAFGQTDRWYAVDHFRVGWSMRLALRSLLL
jgi:hypothetical protein